MVTAQEAREIVINRQKAIEEERARYIESLCKSYKDEIISTAQQGITSLFIHAKPQDIDGMVKYFKELSYNATKTAEGFRIYW